MKSAVAPREWSDSQTCHGKFGDHREFLWRSRPAGERLLREYGNAFNPEEAEIIRKYYGWMVGLAEGLLNPDSAEQERFVAVAFGKEAARTKYEKTFVKAREVQWKSAHLATRSERPRSKPKVECYDRGGICICRGTNPNCSKCDGTGWATR